MEGLRLGFGFWSGITVFWTMALVKTFAQGDVGRLMGDLGSFLDVGEVMGSLVGVGILF